MTTIQERHLAILLDPQLISSMRRNDIQRSDVQPELAGLRELADTSTEREELMARYRCSVVGYGFTDVVDSRLMETEDMSIVCVLAFACCLWCDDVV